MSYGVGCGTTTPSVNSRITSYLSWISNITEGESFCRKWEKWGNKAFKNPCQLISFLMHSEMNGRRKLLLVELKRYAGTIINHAPPKENMKRPQHDKMWRTSLTSAENCLKILFNQTFPFRLINCRHFFSSSLLRCKHFSFSLHLLLPFPYLRPSFDWVIYSRWIGSEGWKGLSWCRHISCGCSSYAYWAICIFTKTKRQSGNGIKSWNAFFPSREVNVIMMQWWTW